MDGDIQTILNAPDRDVAAAEAGLSQQRASEMIILSIREGRVGLDEFMSPERRAILASAWAQHGYEYLSPVKRASGDGFSWIDVRVSRELARSGFDTDLGIDRSEGGRQVPRPEDDTQEQSQESVGPLPVGTRVRLKKDLARQGIVRRAQEADDSDHYLVFLSSGEELWFDVNDLQIVPDRLPIRAITREAFLRRLALTKLTSRFSDIFYAYRASRTNFEVYQFKPVLKFISMDTPGLLIADEVGLGKTIEAAIIYLEMKARADLQRVLVVCPAGLTRKWQSELLLRFDEDFAILNRPLLQAYISNYQATEGHLPLRAIVSLESVRDESIRELLSEAGISLDLVIFDEAHHLRNRSTKSHEVAESLTNMATRSVLLTATPLQTHEQDLFNLLQLIAPGDFQDYDEFETQLRPNAFLNRAIQMLGKAPPDVDTARQLLESLPSVPYSEGIARNPIYTQSVERLGLGGIPKATELVAMRRDLQLLNTIGHVYTRTKKRDVTGVAKRMATTIEVELTEPEERFYNAVIEWVRASSRTAGGKWGVLGFNLINRERQAASCMPASREYLRELLARRASDLEIESSDPSIDIHSSRAPESPQSIAAVEQLLEAAQAIEGVDSKYDQFRAALGDALARDDQAKIIIFSFFKRTLRYLEERLHKDGLSPLLITGDDRPEARARKLEEFRDDPERHILLSSEVGAEGLDFQFAYTIFNYDLPWNPMRVEQRIGRIDRYGQTRKKIFIINLVLKDTIESRILTRLYHRINVFEEAVGDLEPILGDVINFLTRSLFEHDLSAAEEQALAHQVEMRISEKERDLQEFESRRAELMGEDRLFEDTVADRVMTGRFVSPDELVALIKPWLERQFPKTQLYDNPEDRSWHMRGDADLGAHLSQNRYGEGGRDPEGRSFLQRMLAGKTVPLTFDPDLASGRPRVELIHPRHPLTLAAADYWRDRLLALGTDDLACLEVETDEVAPGTYDFFLFKLDVQAVTPTLTFEPVALRSSGTYDETVSRILLRLLVGARESDDDDVDEAGFLRQRERAEAVATAVRTQREAEAMSRNHALLSLRSEAINRAELAKLRRAMEYVQRVSEPRILRMKQREIENIHASRKARLAALEEKRDVLVSVQEVGAGRLTINLPSKGDRPNSEPASGEESDLAPPTTDWAPEFPDGSVSVPEPETEERIQRTTDITEAGDAYELEHEIEDERLDSTPAGERTAAQELPRRRLSLASRLGRLLNRDER